MRRQIATHAADPARQKRWLTAFAGIATASDVAFVFRLAGTEPSVLAALKSPRPENADTLITPLFESNQPELRAQGVRLAGMWKVASFTDRIRKLALEQNATEALDALLILKPEEFAQHALSRLRSVKTPQEAAPLLNTLLSRNEGRAALERALQKTEALDPNRAKLALQTLHTLGKSDQKISSLLMKLAGINTALPSYTKDNIAKIVASAAAAGNAAEGKKVYEQAGCVACHIPGPAQSKIGPDLSSVSRGLPVDMIVTEVVWPGLNVKEGYEAATVTMKDGTVLTGFKHTETAEAIGVRDMTTGMVKNIKRSDTREIKTGGTLMPDGLTATLSPQQLADLIRYLSELGK
jgi:putative heme-binding domain-containing protein